MNKICRLILLFALVFVVKPAESKMIKVMESSGTESVPVGTGPLAGFTLIFGFDCPGPWTQYGSGDFNNLVLIPHNFTTDIYISMLDRTYTSPPNDFLSGYEGDRMWTEKRLDTGLALLPVPDPGRIGGGNLYIHVPIPDLSAYKIEDLYLYNNVSQGDSLITYNLQIYADAKPLGEVTNHRHVK